jgi:hypothetical protein
VAVECSIPHVLSPVEEGYRGCPSHDVEHPAPVHTSHEVHMQIDTSFISLRAQMSIKKSFSHTISSQRRTSMR